MKKVGIQYKLIDQSSTVLKLELVLNNEKEQSFDFQVGKHRVYLKADTCYWDLNYQQWVSANTFDAGE